MHLSNHGGQKARRCGSARVHVFAPLFCFIIVAILLDLLLVPSFYPWVGRSRALIYAGLGVWLTFCLLLLLATCSAVFESLPLSRVSQS